MPHSTLSFIMHHGLYNMEKTKKILLIDDDPGMHEVTRTFLNKVQYECVSAFNGEEGLQKILEESPQLILLDHIMPGMDGEQVYNELISNQLYARHREIPVVILTAKESDLITKTKLLKKGVKVYLNKPFGLWELKNVLENIFITSEIQLKNRQLQLEIAEAKEHLELLFDNTLIGLLSTNVSGVIVKANPFLYNLLEIKDQKQLIGFNVFEKNLFNGVDLRDQFRKIIGKGETLDIENLEFNSIKGNSIKINLRGVPIKNIDCKISGLALIVKDVTEIEKKAYELSILREIGEAMQGTLDLEELLHLLLTGITSGCALGFSRAMLFLLNSSGEILEGKMGVGPSSAEDASRIWGEFSEVNMSLKVFLEKYGKLKPPDDDHFNRRVKQIKQALENDTCFLVKTIKKKKPIKVDKYSEGRMLCIGSCRELEADEFISVPLIVKDKVIGVVVADNLYNHHPIDNNSIELLTLFASQAAVAIERAEAYSHLEQEKNKLEGAYIQLKEAQERLLHAERLATIGKMTAHVAHEIRNPLVTIGGFARSIVKSVANKNNEELKMSAQIIADEVSRLEQILANVLDFTKLSRQNFEFEDINQIIEDACLMVKDEIVSNNINVLKKLDLSIEPMQLDPRQIKQVLINLIRNALYSMPDGGTLELVTSKNSDHVVVNVKDTGEGISADVLPNMFNPFFTTKPHGTGLGLAITQQIIHAHKGRIDVQSEVGKGTAFTFNLPVKTKRDSA